MRQMAELTMLGLVAMLNTDNYHVVGQLCDKHVWPVDIHTASCVKLWIDQNFTTKVIRSAARPRWRANLPDHDSIKTCQFKSRAVVPRLQVQDQEGDRSRPWLTGPRPVWGCWSEASLVIRPMSQSLGPHQMGMGNMCYVSQLSRIRVMVTINNVYVWSVSSCVAELRNHVFNSRPLWLPCFINDVFHCQVQICIRLDIYFLFSILHVRIVVSNKVSKWCI